MGKTVKSKTHKKYRDIKCQNRDCKEKINIDYAISVNDFDYVDDTKSKIYVYCPKCGLQHEIKL